MAAAPAASTPNPNIPAKTATIRKNIIKRIISKVFGVSIHKCTTTYNKHKLFINYLTLIVNAFLISKKF